MKWTWKAELPHLLLIALMAVAAVVAWNRVPDRLPVHWGFDGRPDRWGGRFEGLALFPLLAAGLYLLLLALPRFDPGRRNYEQFRGPYATIRLALVAFIAAIFGFQLAAYGNPALRISQVVTPALGALLVVLGNLMGKLRPNWFVGIRTPWTLSSKRSWTQTHRVGGWVLFAGGLLTISAGLLAKPWMIQGAMVAGAVAVLGLVVYSYVVWKGDPDKIPPAGTLPAEDGPGAR